jgi:hypothetical protein
VVLLHTLFAWAYERSTLEYLAIRQSLAETVSLRLAWRDLIKHTIRDIVLYSDLEPLTRILRAVFEQVPGLEQYDVQALVVEVLRRLHEEGWPVRDHGHPITRPGRPYAGIEAVSLGNE